MNRLNKLNKMDKLKLLMIALLFLLIAFVGGIEIYHTYMKPSTVVHSKTELQSFLNDTCWIREDDDTNVDLLIFSQFMDLYDATLNEYEELYNNPVSYRILDYKTIDVFNIVDNDDGIRFLGKHELIVKDKNTIVIEDVTYKKDDLHKWFKKIYYD